MKRLVCIVWICCLAFSLARAENTPGLVIVNVGGEQDARLCELLWEFTEKHPAVRVVLRQVEEHETLLAMLEAGEADIVGLYRRQYLEAAEKGLLLPLDSASAPACLLADGTYLNFRPYLTYNGQLYGMPRQWLRSGFYLDEQLAEACHFVLPNAPYGWQDLLYAVRSADIEPEAGVCLTCDNPDCPYLLRQFLSRQYHEKGWVCFEDETLRDELAAYKSLYRMGLIAENLLAVDVELLLPRQNSMKHYRQIAAPCDGEIVSLYMISAAKNSRNRALAEEFLAMYAGAVNQNRAHLGDESAMLLANPSGYDTQTPCEYSEEMRIRAFDTMIAGENPGDFIMQCIKSGSMRAYLEDQITQDEMIAQLQAIMDAQM